MTVGKSYRSTTGLDSCTMSSTVVGKIAKNVGRPIIITRYTQVPVERDSLRTWIVKETPVLARGYSGLFPTKSSNSEVSTPPAIQRCGDSTATPTSDDLSLIIPTQTAPFLFDTDWHTSGKPLSFKEVYNLHWHKGMTKEWRLRRCEILLPLMEALHRILLCCVLEDHAPDTQNRHKFFRLQGRLRHLQEGLKACISRLKAFTADDVVACSSTGALRDLQIDAEGMVRRTVSRIVRWRGFRELDRRADEMEKARIWKELVACRRRGDDKWGDWWAEAYHDSVLVPEMREKLWRDYMGIVLKVQDGKRSCISEKLWTCLLFTTSGDIHSQQQLPLLEYYALHRHWVDGGKANSIFISEKFPVPFEVPPSF
ncbi:hypothetical protein BJ508DRAFT_304240 [Ascobolus immersus RN42]|uniref:Uncharacterized protein n=1 Tax=Ascobolus immersus RN42 TaxID=1160509 RepID=A0A3N4IEQ8_ASCIM|nr:hypothetical protein BJ508DRAFT_304240 [Ascobolus immersus RN42]